MAKSDYTKVEGTLDKELKRMSIDHLLEVADQNPNAPVELTRSQVARLIYIEAERLYKKDKAIYKKLKIRSKDLKEKAEKARSLTDQEWKQMEKLRKKLSEFAKEIEEKSPATSEEEQVEKERVKHINKRFNTNEKWLPLH